MKKCCVLILIMLSTVVAPYASTIRITKIQGEVQVRHGLEEGWSLAKAGMNLEYLDSIMTGPESSVTIETEEGYDFSLGPLSMIDVADLRRLSQREMFLFIMGQKIERLKPAGEGTKLEIGSVSTVHGENKSSTPVIGSQPDSDEKELNGARALQHHRFFTNAIVKYHKMLRAHQALAGCGIIQQELAFCFEKIQQPGQALDFYLVSRTLLAENPCHLSDSRERLELIDAALARLKKNQSFDK